MKKTILLGLALAFTGLCASQAQAIIVYDPSNHTQMITQINQMVKEYQKQLEQLNQAIKQTNAITGTRDMGSLANGALEEELRRTLPNTWQQTMNMINATGISGSASGAQRLYSDLYATYTPARGAEFIPADPNGPIAKSIDRRTETTYAAMAASEQSYNNVSSHITIYETLLKELNNTTDLKASVDLQSRIAAENGLILSELMRLNAIQIQQKAAQDNETLTGYRRAGSANRYDSGHAAQAFTQKE